MLDAKRAEDLATRQSSSSSRDPESRRVSVLGLQPLTRLPLLRAEPISHPAAHLDSPAHPANRAAGSGASVVPEGRPGALTMKGQRLRRGTHSKLRRGGCALRAGPAARQGARHLGPSPALPGVTRLAISLSGKRLHSRTLALAPCPALGPSGLDINALCRTWSGPQSSDCRGSWCSEGLRASWRAGIGRGR
jgi:hypothetical protein